MIQLGDVKLKEELCCEKETLSCLSLSGGAVGDTPECLAKEQVWEFESQATQSL